MQDFTSFTPKHDNSKIINKSEILEILKNKLEYLLSEKIYFLNTNIEFLDDWMFLAIQSDDKNVRRTVKWYYSEHIDELDDIILYLIKEIGKENVEENELNKEFVKLIRGKDRYKNEVVQIYKIILNRHPDNSELLHYSNMLKYDIIDTERIEEILKNSDDYKRIENKRKDTNNEINNMGQAWNHLVPDFKFGDKINIKEISIPKMTRDDTDVNDGIDDHYTNIINKAYEEILQRNLGDNGLYVDDDGLKTYLSLMRNGMTEDKLRDILKNSQEYKDNFGEYEQKYTDKIDIAPKIDISSPNIIYHTTVHPSIKNDIGKDKKIKESLAITDTSSVSQLKLVYCMMGTNRLEEIKPYIETVLPYIDKFIFIDGGSEDGTAEYLKSLNKGKGGKIEVYVYPWQDRFSAQRNNYLAKLEERNYDGWVIVSDTDESFPVESLKRIRELIHEIEIKGYSGIQVQVIDVTVGDDDFDRIICSKKNEYWKALIFKYGSNLRYEGEPHETLTGIPIRWFKSTSDNIFYEHRRSKLHILKRATENYFISNSNRYSERWAEFRFLCTKSNILNFKDYWKLFIEHKLPKDIEDWIHKHKDDDLDSGDSEVREMAQLYFDILPKRMKKKSEPDKVKEEHIKITESICTSNMIEVRIQKLDDGFLMLSRVDENSGKWKRFGISNSKMVLEKIGEILETT